MQEEYIKAHYKDDPKGAVENYFTKIYYSIYDSENKNEPLKIDYNGDGEPEYCRVSYLSTRKEVQGWLRESEMMHAFVPTDSISQAIYLFSDTHASYFIIIFALFVAVWLFRAFRRKQLRMVYFNDIDSLYPLLLCLLMAFCATIYESIQVFAPETWQHFYFNPTLSPFKVPLVLSAFLMGIWLFIVVLLAVLDDLFRQLSPAAAVFYLLGLASCCIFCYFFFILTTSIYVGYLFLTAFVWVFLKRLRISLLASRYRCGRCGQKLREKGVCPHCGAINE